MGGKVFQGTSDFDHSAIGQILKTVNKSLEGTGITAIPVWQCSNTNTWKTFR